MSASARGYAVYLDGRVSMRSSASGPPRWGRPWPLRDLLILLERHAPRMLAPDPFHVPSSELEETGANAHVRTTVTSWSLARPVDAAGDQALGHAGVASADMNGASSADHPHAATVDR